MSFATPVRKDGWHRHGECETCQSLVSLLSCKSLVKLLVLKRRSGKRTVRESQLQPIRRLEMYTENGFMALEDYRFNLAFEDMISLQEQF